MSVSSRRAVTVMPGWYDRPGYWLAGTLLANGSLAWNDGTIVPPAVGAGQGSRRDGLGGTGEEVGWVRGRVSGGWVGRVGGGTGGGPLLPLPTW